MLGVEITAASPFDWASQVALVVKNPTAKAGDLRDTGSIPGSGRAPGGGVAAHSSTLAWTIPWTEEPGRLPSIGSQSQTQLKQLSLLHVTAECVCVCVCKRRTQRHKWLPWGRSQSCPVGASWLWSLRHTASSASALCFGSEVLISAGPVYRAVAG